MISLDVATITLAKGQHETCEDGMCLFEAYNQITRREQTDACPPGVSPVLHIYGMRLNDVLPDDRRQELKRYLPNGTDVLAGTAGDGLDGVRAWMALDWLIRVYAPAWLDLAGLAGEASALRNLAPVTDSATAEAARLAGAAAGDAARAAAWAAAWAAARDAAWAAAWAAAGAAARDAAWDAAGAAAGDAARDAARAAARAAARDAAGAAARDAARDAAGAAARDAARDAARAAARDAAWAAAGAALAPTVARLQDSAIALYADLITGGVS